MIHKHPYVANSHLHPLCGIFFINFNEGNFVYLKRKEGQFCPINSATFSLFSVFFSPTGHHRRPPTTVFRRLKLQITSSSLSLSILTTNVSSSPPPSSSSSPVLSYVYVLRFSKIQSATTFYTDFEEQRHRF